MKQKIIKGLGVLLFVTNLNASYVLTNVNDTNIVKISNNDLTNKNFDANTMLFAALSSSRVYDDNFNLENSANFQLYKKNNMQITTYTKIDSNHSLESSIAKKVIDNKTLIVISFRGTKSTQTDGNDDILTDLETNATNTFSDKNISVHSGFFADEQLFEKGMKDIKFDKSTSLIDILNDANKTNSNIQFLITGHSLGGAIATLLTARLIDHYHINPDNIVTYTFGAPASGDEAFQNLFENDSNESVKHFYRIKNTNDPVPLLTTKEFITYLKNSSVLKTILKKLSPNLLTKLLNTKDYYYHIGKLYLFNNGILYPKNNLNTQITTESILSLNIKQHKLKTAYIPNIENYLSNNPNILAFQNGWNLVSTNYSLNNIKCIKNLDTKIIMWKYDSKNKEWLGNTNDDTLQQEFSSKNIPELNSIKKGQGFWIYALNNSGINFSECNISTVSDDSLQIYKGWNLLGNESNKSITSSTLLSEYPNSEIIWKFDNKTKKWKALSDNNSTMQTIKNNNIDFVNKINIHEGYWIYNNINEKKFYLQKNL